MTLFLSRILLPLLALIATMIVMDCKVTESVVFHPMDWIYNTICSWILTNAIDFNPSKDPLFGINQYALKVQQSLTRYFETFQSSILRYSLLLYMTMVTQIETINLTDNILRPKDFRMKRSLLSFGRLFNFLFGTARDEDVRSMNQDIKKLYDNQISQSKVLNIISIANILRGLINENILRIKQIVSTITFINDTIDSIMNQLRPLFSAKRFLLLLTKMLIHHSRNRTLLSKCKLTQPRLNHTSTSTSQGNLPHS